MSRSGPQATHDGARRGPMKYKFAAAAAVAAAALVLPGMLLVPAAAQDKVEDRLSTGRQMLAEDNPGDLWTERGERLYHEKRGPNKVSLERCDLGMGPGV